MVGHFSKICMKGLIHITTWAAIRINYSKFQTKIVHNGYPRNLGDITSKKDSKKGITKNSCNSYIHSFHDMVKQSLMLV